MTSLQKRLDKTCSNYTFCKKPKAYSNCLTNNLTIGNNVASIRMLPSGTEKMPGGANDEPTQQKGIMGERPTKVSKSLQS
jgi:hypothetical protein